MIKSFSLMLLLLLILSGCTGAKFVVNPELNTIKHPTTKGCGKIAVTESNPDISKNSIPDRLVVEFAKYLQSTGLFDEVYCPVRDTDRFNITLDAKFHESVDTNGGSNFFRSAMIGLSLYLFEPVIWYESNLDMSGRVDVKKDGSTLMTFNSNTKTDLYRKHLSGGAEFAQMVEKEAYPATMKATFAQLVHDLEIYCKNSAREQ